MKPVMVMTYPNSPGKMDTLIKTIDNIKKSDREIILVTHFPNIPSDIQTKVDYFIYDKRNKVYHNDMDALGWITLTRNNFRIMSRHFSLINHTHAVHTLFLSGLSFCKNVLNLDYVHIMEYDQDWEESRFLDFNEYFLNEKNKSGLFYRNGVEGTYGGDCQLSPCYMYVDVDSMWGAVSQINTDEKIEQYIKCGSGRIYEEFLKSEIDQYSMDYLVEDREYLSKNYGFKWNTQSIEYENNAGGTNCCCCISPTNELFIFTLRGEYMIVWNKSGRSTSISVNTSLHSWNIVTLGNYIDVDNVIIFKKNNGSFNEVLNFDLMDKSQQAMDKFRIDSNIEFN